MTGIGLAVPASVADDHFTAALAHACAEPLIAQGIGLFVRVVPDRAAEERMHRHWAQAGISGVALLGAVRDDRRIDVLRDLGLPFAAVVDREHAGDFPAVVIDVDASVAVISEFLAGRRHERAVYIAGPTDSLTSQSRAAAVADRFEVIAADRAPGSAVAAADAVLAQGPATLLFDSDVHAAAATEALIARGVRVPDDAAIVSWTDSALCRSATPSITAVDRRGSEIGLLLGRRMLATIAGAATGSDRAPDPFVVRRESA